MYYVVLAILYLISFLPLWIIYRISDIVAFFMCHILRYRRDVLMQNLNIAFPEKSQHEKKIIIRRFYINFVDTFLEAIKLLSLPERTLRKKIQFDASIFEELYATGKSCQVHLGHNFNWEWVNVRVTKQVLYPFLVVYMPIGNKVVDRLFKYFREKNGSIMLPATSMRTAILPYRNTQYLLALVADQNPGRPDSSYWVKFFDKWTPFVTGPEKNARLNDIPVVFARIYKPRRGYYVIESKLAALHPREKPEGQLTLEYVRYLEEVIRKQPEAYLWTHNRWKYDYDPNFTGKKFEDEMFVEGSGK